MAFGDHRETAAAAAAFDQPRQEVGRTLQGVERVNTCSTGFLRPGRFALTGFDRIPEILLDNPQFRNVLDDLTLRKGAVSRYIEVAGCCGSDRVTRNDEERKWLARLDQRLNVYRALDITPVLIWLDLFARPAELKDLCVDLVDDVALRGA